ncbi:hypothetical protein MD537_24620, partial [Flavihumibacter sediminis]|nr:hypothetical protein [Flavihumibacter sediminis]
YFKVNNRNIYVFKIGRFGLLTLFLLSSNISTGYLPNFKAKQYSPPSAHPVNHKIEYGYSSDDIGFLQYLNLIL